MEKTFRTIQPLYRYWQQAMKSHCFDDFRRELDGFPDSTVMTWGFPPHAIQLAEEIQAAGVDCWWFTGHEDVARKVWLKREGHTDPKYFNIQVSEIRNATDRIEKLFGDRKVDVFDEMGRFRNREEVAVKLRIGTK